MILRDYQVAALAALRSSLARLKASGKPPRSVLVAPTGAGKTTIAAEMIRGATARGLSTLFLAHRLELIEQCSARLDSIAVDHGIIMAAHPRTMPGMPVQIASVQTLVRRTLPAPPSLIIIDEAHHARAGTYERILGRFPAAVVVGLTATPVRQDGRGLGELFGDLVVVATTRQLIEAGHLVPLEGFSYSSPDLHAIAKVAGEYDLHALGEAMSAKKLLGDIVAQWKLYCAGKRTVVFAVHIAHSKDIVDRFIEAGVRAEHVDGETPELDRRAILGRLRSGETELVSNVGIVTEGFDLPELEVAILARPTLSLGLYLQMVGRIMRPAQGKTSGRIHDHAQCVYSHGSPDADRKWALEYDSKIASSAPKALGLRTCEKCLRVWIPTSSSGGRVCPSCGHVSEIKTREIEEVVNEVRAIPIHELAQLRDASEAQKLKSFELLKLKAAAKGYKPAWAAVQFKIRYGHWPSGGRQGARPDA